MWNAGIPVTHGELTQLDQTLVKAPNFAEGGTYAPTTPIYVGNAGMQIKLVGSSSLDSGAALDCLSGSFLNIQSGGNFQLLAGSTGYVAGQFYLNAGSNTDIFGAVHLRSGGGYVADAGSNTFLNGSVAVGGNIGFTSTVHFDTTSVTTHDGPVTFNATSTFTGSTAFGSQPLFAAGAIVRNVVLMQTSGRVVKRPPVVIASTGSNITGYGPANADTVIVRALTAPVAIYVPLGQNGDEFTVINKSSTNQLEVHDDNTGLPVFAMINRSGNFRSVTLVQAAGAWEVLRTEPGVGGNV